jgi:Nif-specific regulatory protein
MNRIFDIKTENLYHKYLNASRNVIIGKSKKMVEVYKKLQKVCDRNVTVIIRGNSGVGKELIAENIHYNSKRKNYPFVTVNCAAITPTLIENELFGHVKGSYTGAISSEKGKFELADKGTIFLDEIGALPLNMQSKILRVLQEKTFHKIGDNKVNKVDVRVICATSANLEHEILNKNFRKDLYYRINVFPINLPDLKEHKEDIELLVKHFVNQLNESNNYKINKIDKKLINKLKKYDWPGNIRELQNIINRLYFLSDTNILSFNDLDMSDLELFKEDKISKTKNILELNLNQDFGFMEKQIIESVLQNNHFNIKKTAEQLKLNRKTIYNKIKKYNIILKEN